MLSKKRNIKYYKAVSCATNVDIVDVCFLRFGLLLYSCNPSRTAACAFNFAL